MTYQVTIRRNLVNRAGSGIWFIRYDLQTRDTWVAMPLDLVWEHQKSECFHLPTPTLAVDPELLPAFAQAFVDNHELPASFLSNDAENKAVKDHLAGIQNVNSRLLGLLESKL